MTMSTRIPVRRAARVPDGARLDRCRRAPELGPRILFFSGGSALAKVSRKLKQYTHNSVHLMTPFDSGGSSAEIRRAFRMLSVGDLRNRLLSLADETIRGNPEIYALFSSRLPAQGERTELRGLLDEMVLGSHALVAGVPEPLRQIVRTHLRDFRDAMPDDFDLRRASIGNLVLTGGYLTNERDIDAVIFLFSQLVEVRGTVRPIVDGNVHLAAELASGERVVGQHNLTGKEYAPIGSPVRALTLVDGLEDAKEVHVQASEEIQALIREAELLCYPVGSFYSSVIANLLPRGVGRAIAEADCPKIFVPNMGHDPECIDVSLDGAVAQILEAVRRDTGADTPADRILNAVFVDTLKGTYEMTLEPHPEVEVIDLPLVRPNGWPLIDANAYAELLISLV